MMKQSLPGMLKNAAKLLEESGLDDYAYGFTLLELLKNLRELRADPTLLGEFFDLYVDEGFEAWKAEKTEAPEKPEKNEDDDTYERLERFRLGQRVRVIGGELEGKTGTVVRCCIQSDEAFIDMDEPLSVALARFPEGDSRRNHIKLWPDECEAVEPNDET